MKKENNRFPSGWAVLFGMLCFLCMGFPDSARSGIPACPFKVHTILGSPAGAQMNYHMRVKVHSTAGTDSGEKVYLGASSGTGFSNVRFQNSDGTQDLDFWIEDITGETATCQVKIPSIPASPGSTDI